MFDSEYKAQLSDLGLSYLNEHNWKSFTATVIVGTLSYIAHNAFTLGEPWKNQRCLVSKSFSFRWKACKMDCG